MLVVWTQAFLKNKPAVQAADADPSPLKLHQKAELPIPPNPGNFGTSNAIWMLFKI